MKERIRSNENSGSFISRKMGEVALGTAVVAVAAMYLIAGPGDSSARRSVRQPVQRISATQKNRAVERVGVDYMGQFYFNTDEENQIGVSGQDCLGGTSYDLARDLAPKPRFEFNDGRLVIRITPPGKPELDLVGFNDHTHYLQPLDSASAKVLRQNGCQPNAPYPLG